MKRITRTLGLAAAGAALFIVAGCVDIETIVSVSRDGSGYVERTVLMSNEVIGMLSSMSGEEEFSLLEEAELVQEAEAMGAELVESETIEAEHMAGYRARFNFSNVNDLRLNQNPGTTLPEQAQEDETDEFVHFALEKGNRPVLTIRFPEPEADTEQQEYRAERQDSTDSQDIETVKHFYRDMRISMKITFPDGIRRTNSSYRDGNTITLMEIDFGKIIENEEVFSEIMNENIESVESLKRYVERVEGLKAETVRPVEVVFK